MTQTYTYSTSANVVIPTEPSSTQDNTLVYTTDMGTATFDFAVPFPALRVDGVLCEFVNAGDSMTVLGENFDFYHMADNLSVTTADANDAPLPIAAVTRNSLKVVVPAGTPDNTTFYLEWTDSGDAALAQAFPPALPSHGAPALRRLRPERQRRDANGTRWQTASDRGGR